MDLKIVKALGKPTELQANTIYIIKKDNNLADIVVTDLTGQASYSVTGFSEGMIQQIAISTKLLGLTKSTEDVAPTDTLLEAIGKISGKSELFGQGVSAEAVGSVTQFSAVPETFQSPYVIVMEPHLRMMVWNGQRYVRAPWHRPGVLFHTLLDPEDVPHGVQARNDIAYATSSHPDLAEILGATGPTFTLPDARARVLRGADLGKGIDATLVNGATHEDAMARITGGFVTVVPDGHGNFTKGVFAGSDGTGIGVPSTSDAVYYVAGGSYTDTSRWGYRFDNARSTATADENRVKSLTAAVYVTR